MVYHGRDSGRWSAPVHRVASRSAHIAVGVGHGRESSTWLKYLGPGSGEGAATYENGLWKGESGPRVRGGSLLEGRLVCAELANRGVKDVLIVEGAPPA